MITIFVLSGRPPGLLAAVAVVASLTRIICGITTVRHATRMRSR